jgi:hypothetical protein
MMAISTLEKSKLARILGMEEECFLSSPSVFHRYKNAGGGMTRYGTLEE